MKKVYESDEPSELRILTVSPDCEPIALNGPLNVKTVDDWLDTKYPDTSDDPDTDSVFVPLGPNVALMVSYLYTTTLPLVDGK
jgi:hypothetical protein